MANTKWRKPWWSGEAKEPLQSSYKDVLRRAKGELAKARSPTQEAKAPKEDRPAARAWAILREKENL